MPIRQLSFLSRSSLAPRPQRFSPFCEPAHFSPERIRGKTGTRKDGVKSSLDSNGHGDMVGTWHDRSASNVRAIDGYVAACRKRNSKPPIGHCEEGSDEAISHFVKSSQRYCFALLAMTNWRFNSFPARVNGHDDEKKTLDRQVIPVNTVHAVLQSNTSR
jgi:hypothetical protein